MIKFVALFLALFLRGAGSARVTGDGLPVGVYGVTPVHKVEEHGQADPQPIPANQPDPRRVQDHIKQGGEGQEDDSNDRPKPASLKRGVEHDGASDPKDHIRYSWEQSGK